jgi:hypothetical protein
MINPPAIIHSKIVGVVYKFLTARKVLIIQTLAIPRKPDGGTRLATQDLLLKKQFSFVQTGTVRVCGDIRQSFSFTDDNHTSRPGPIRGTRKTLLSFGAPEVPEK